MLSFEILHVFLQYIYIYKFMCSKIAKTCRFDNSR